MPKKRYTPEMEAARLAVLAAHRHRVEHKLSLEERIRLEMQRESVALEMAESAAANQALALGVTNTDVIRALGIGNWHTFKALLALTEERFKSDEEIKNRPKWEIVWDGERPKEVTLWEYKDAKTKAMVAEKYMLAVKWLPNTGVWSVDHYDLALDSIWIRRTAEEIEAEIAAQNPPPPDEPKTDIYNKPLLPDDYFTPKWTLGQAEYDEDDA
jgi:hypothetical protein